MKPFYFGDSACPLFGIYHPPRGTGRLGGAVLCPPFGPEYLCAHRSLRELASRLAAADFHVLRFDYRGTGDSAGEAEEGRLEGWLADIAAACAEMRETSGSSRLSLLGLRLGATLAVRAAERDGGIEALALWDPVVDGAGYVAELQASHQAWLREHGHGAKSGREVLGFPLPEALAGELAAVSLDPRPGLPARRTLVVTSAEGQDGRWPQAPDGLEQRRFPPAPVWLHAEGMERALVPGELLDFVAGWLGATGAAGR